MNQYVKFVPNLSTLCPPLRSLLNKKSTYHWNDSHRAQIVNIIENNHLDIKRPSRLKTDASGSGLVFTLEKGDSEAWITIAFTTRFSTSHEMKCSTNELEMLGVVWATKHFKNYVYGSEFEIVTDHKALMSASNANHGNKDMHSRLKWWLNGLLPLSFKIRHTRKGNGIYRSFIQISLWKSPPTITPFEDPLGKSPPNSRLHKSTR